MSLFPAYCADVKSNDSENDNQQTVNKNQDPEWLKNSSYQKISAYLQSAEQNSTWIDSSDNDDDDDSVVEVSNEKNQQDEIVKNQSDEILKKTASRHKNKKEKIKTKRKANNEHFETDHYYMDKNRNKRYCTIQTLERAVRPNYKLSHFRLKTKYGRKFKKEYFHQRYYLVNLNTLLKEEAAKSSKSDNELENDKDTTSKMIDNTFDDEYKKATEEFNKKLAECPSDIDTWLEYIQYQDKVVQLTSFSSKKKNIDKIINQKKLSIIEKGMMVNCNSLELLKEKLKIMSHLLPADQLSDQIETMINRDSKNIILWQSLINVIQTSCALCKVSKVTSLYAKCFPILRQKSKINLKFYEKEALGLLYQCLTFLRNVGLWEQMWETIRLNLCLNLTLEHETLKDVKTIDEKALMDMEELILKSKLPLDQLWLRIESLRENCYWTSVNVNSVDVNLIGDEKRLITAEEINDFIYPTVSKESNFQLVLSSILCLKVPLLPTRHSTLKDFLLEEHYSNIDSLEFILPMIYSTTWTGKSKNYLTNKDVITNLLEGKLTSGPQFLKYHPSKQVYLEFVRSVFNVAAQALPENQRTSILIWWLRFERLLVFFNKHDPLREKDEMKKLKHLIKSFLKKAENRNNLHFYREFALIEYELGAVESSLQILKTIILSQDPASLNIQENIAHFSLYRTIFEILLDSNTYKDETSEIVQEIGNNLKTFVSKNFSYNLDMPLEDMLYNEILKFLMNPVEDELEDQFLLPNIHCDVLICYIYLLYLKNNTDIFPDVLDLCDQCLIHCNQCPRLKERFYEIKIIFLQFYENKINKVDSVPTKTIVQALEEFPNNFYFLSLNASIESELPFWKLKIINEDVTIWTIFAKCLAGRARITYLNEIGMYESADAMVNKMISFHTTVSKLQKIQGCSLVWKFYMLLIREHNLCEKKGEEIYYEAVNQCPWARSVYLNAAEVAPQILPQVQDLMKEKEIRIHVTPEELDILRE